MGDEHKFGVPKPVEKGETFNVKIESQGGQGDGIAKIEGFVVFVKGARKGEECKIKIIEVKRTFATAEKISGINPSEEELEMDDEVEGSKTGPSG